MKKAQTEKKTAAKSSVKKTVAKSAAKKAAVKEEPFSVFVTELDQYLFGNGVHYDIYKKLGSHETVKDGKDGIYFAVWAPKASAVMVIGSFNGWKEEGPPMIRPEAPGVRGAFFPGGK